MLQTKVKRRPLGKTGVMVSEVSFGAMNLRTLPDHDAVNTLINGVLAQGINCIDTARGYNTMELPNAHNETGVVIESEVMLGKLISARTDIDEPLVIITKGHGYTKEAFRSHLDESLARLQVRQEADGLYIGQTKIYLCYLLHGLKEERWRVIRETNVLDFAKDIQNRGEFSFFGFSSHYGDRPVIREAIESGAFDVCELPYNVYNPSLGEEGEPNLMRMAYEKGMGVINMKAFNGNGTAPIFRQLSGLTGISYADMARYCLSNPYISTIDAGARSVAEFMVDVEASLEPPMQAEQRQALRARARKISPHLNTICRECMHCLEKFECPQGVDFPSILGVHGRYTLSSELGFETAQYHGQYAKLIRNDAACIACGACVPWCEYDLNIPELLAKAAAELA